jgi:hypothetical protein
MMLPPTGLIGSFANGPPSGFATTWRVRTYTAHPSPANDNRK